MLGSTACPAVMVAVGRVCKLGLLLLALEMQSAPGRMAIDQLDSACFNSGVRKRLGRMPASNPGAPTVGNGVPAAKNPPNKMALLATGLEKSPVKWVLDQLIPCGHNGGILLEIRKVATSGFGAPPVARLLVMEG